MKTKLILVVAMILALAATGYWLSQRSDRVDNVQADVPAAQSEATETINPSVATETTMPAPAPVRSGEGYIDPKQLCGEDFACRSAPTTATSEADYQWMLRHGYPTAQESRRLAGMTEAQLKDEASKGSLTAMTALGTRMIERGDNNGLTLFSRAADRGSVYSYYETAKAVGPMRGSIGGWVEQGAFLRLAYILGDYKAAEEYYRFAENKGLDVGEMYIIDRRAASLYQTYAKNRQPTPRPF